jgi:hypothetical protein
MGITAVVLLHLRRREGERKREGASGCAMLQQARGRSRAPQAAAAAPAAAAPPPHLGQPKGMPASFTQLVKLEPRVPLEHTSGARLEGLVGVRRQ